jgi:hypothetical protein
LVEKIDYENKKDIEIKKEEMTIEEDINDNFDGKKSNEIEVDFENEASKSSLKEDVKGGIKCFPPVDVKSVMDNLEVIINSKNYDNNFNSHKFSEVQTSSQSSHPISNQLNPSMLAPIPQTSFRSLYYTALLKSSGKLDMLDRILPKLHLSGF